MSRRKCSARDLLAVSFFLVLFVLPIRAFAGEILFSRTADSQSTYGPSQSWPDAGVNSEVADDFDVTGSIDRVVASGFINSDNEMKEPAEGSEIALVLDGLLDAVDNEEAEHRRLEERKKEARDSRGEKGEGP